MTHQQPLPLLHRIAPLLIAVTGILLTLLITWQVDDFEQTRARAQFKTTAMQVEDAIAARVDVYVALLRGAGAVLQIPEYRRREAFRDYVASVGVSEHYPGIQGIGLAQRVEPGEARELVAQMRSSGHPGFHIWPEPHDRTAYPIVLLEPGDRRNLTAIGYDMYSEPVRHAAMARARETGEPAASGKVTLVQEIDEHKQAGFLVYLPVRDRGTPATASADESDLIGMVYSPFRADDLFAGIFGQHPANGIRFAVFDGPEVSSDALLHQSTGWTSAGDPHLPLERQVEVGGRIWTVLFAPGDAGTARTSAAYWFGAVGLILTALLALLVRNLVREGREAERHAAAMSASEQAVRDSEQLKQAILDAALDCIIAIDERSRIVEFNQAAERILGYAREDALGQPLIDLIIPARLRERYTREMRRHRDTGERNILGRRVEVTVMRSDGSEFPAELALNRIDLRDQVIFTAYLRDITERRQAESRIAELNESLEERVRSRTMELEDANRELESFSYSVSHDLRAPVRHVLGFAELLKKQLAGRKDPNTQHLIGVITDSAGKIARLIDDLLAFSRTSRQELRRGSVAMTDLVEEAVRSLAPETTNRRIEWRVHPLPAVEGDRALLALVWTNLLSNAVKYTRQRAAARITVGSSAADSGPVFFVEDNGTGFDMRYEHKLFRVFQRLHREEEFEGTGVGLANVARIVQRHGGKVWAEGRPGTGATFYFTLQNGTVDHNPPSTINSPPSQSISIGGRGRPITADPEEPDERFRRPCRP